MNYYVDTHCHLDLFDRISENPAVENQHRIKTISVTNAPAFFIPNRNLFQGLDNIRIALGLHPQLVSKFSGQITEFNNKLSLTKYIGEIGLDGSKDIQDTWQLQKEVFEKLLNYIQIDGPKMLTVHSRNAVNETIDTINKYLNNTGSVVILHWFSGNISELSKGEKSGCYFSINHKMVSSDKGRLLIEKLPLSKMLTETDAPFTFDEKVKSRIASLKITIAGIAKIKRLEEWQIEEGVFENFRKILTHLK